jgi:acyl-CoA reductase-like NAD-dependent aldehyde dehydrogenase
VTTQAIIVAGRARREASGGEAAVLDAHSGIEVARLPRAGAAEVEQALAAAQAATGAMRRLPAWRRRDVLVALREGVEAGRESFARTLVAEVGKTLHEARAEVERCLDTLRVAAEEATRLEGEWLPLDISARAESCAALVRRFPVGPCAFITPFNFPLNLVAHKVAPALACGCPFVLRPASGTPLSALALGALLARQVEAGALPPGAFSIVPCDTQVAAPLVEDPRVRLLSFTGSPAVGWALNARAAAAGAASGRGARRVTLELGGNAGCIVDEGADVASVVPRLVAGAFGLAGQSCVKTQRILAHASLHAALRSALVAGAQELNAAMGDPHDERTRLGPLVREAEAQRVEEWVAQAVAGGARVLCGGRRRGAFHEATVLEGVPRDARVSCREVFGPVCTLAPFERFDDALDEVNASDFGLQAGVFTPRLEHALRAHEELEVGGVVVNDVPTSRVDAMPYGGVKGSGQGREGLRSAMREMTEPRVLLLRREGGRA